MAIQDTINQVQTQAQQLVDQLKGQLTTAKTQAATTAEQAKEIPATLKNGGEVLSAGAQELLKIELDAIKAGYGALVEQLQDLKNVKDLESLKVALKDQTEKLAALSEKYVADASKGADVLVKARDELTELLKSATKQAKKVAKKPAAKKTAAKKPAAKKATAAKKPAAPRKSTAAKKATA